MEQTKSLEDLRSEAEELEKQIEAARNGAVIDETGAPVEPKVEETANLPVKEPPWPHQTIEFEGEKWEVRKPKPQALAAFTLASSKYVPVEVQNDMVGLFIRNHMSDKSMRRAYERMFDPEDDFTQETMGRLFARIATVGTDRPSEPSST